MSNGDIVNSDPTARIQMIEKQVKECFDGVHNKANKNFWPGLLNPARHLAAPLGMYSHGDVSQMQLVLKYNYDSWAEIPGAIDVIREKMKV